MGEAEFQIDTISVNELGHAIVNSGQSEKSSTDPDALDNFTRDLESIAPNMPPNLQSALTQFSTNFNKGYAGVIQQRIAIGHILLATATATEKQEVEAVNVFTDIAPQVLVK
jgi:hypothetical protein